MAINVPDKSRDAEALFDELLSLIIKEPLEICIKNNEPIPRIYYIGIGKTGSSSLMKYLDRTVAHWHYESYFESLFKTELLSKYNICLYDLILYIGRRYNFKPLIVESYREPIARAISGLAHSLQRTHWETLSEFTSALNVDLFKEMRDPYSLKWKDYFNVDLIDEFDQNKNHFYKELEDVKLLFLKLEDSENWTGIFSNIGYDYQNIKSNDSSRRSYGALYQEVLDNYRLSKYELNEIYDNEIMKAFYSEDEIGVIKTRWEG